jgi:hypothetical protein
VALDHPAERSTVNIMSDSTAAALRQHNADYGFDGSFSHRAATRAGGVIPLIARTPSGRTAGTE